MEPNYELISLKKSEDLLSGILILLLSYQLQLCFYQNHDVCFLVMFQNSCLQYNVALGSV